MQLHPTMSSSSRRRGTAAFSFVEMLVAVAIGTVVIGVVLSLAIVTSWHFATIYNYTYMDDENGNTLNKLSKEIRNSTALVSFSTNNPVTLQLTNTYGPDGATITFNPAKSLLTLTKPGQNPVTLLSDCTAFSFSLFNRYPLVNSNTCTFYLSTNSTTGRLDPTFTKVINLTWQCTRKVLGSKLNTEEVQTAQVMLRNQVKN